MQSNNNIFHKYLLWFLLLPCYLGMGAALSAQPVKPALQKMITSRLQDSYPSGQYRYTVTVKWLPVQLQKIEAEQLLSVSYEREGKPISYCMFSVSYRTSGVEKKANVQVYVQVEERLPVAVQRLDSGKPLTASDVEWTWVDITKMNGSLISKSSDLKGLVLKRIVTKGSVIKWSDLRRKPVMKPGDQVKLIYNFKGIQIDMDCISRQAGAIGDRVRLFNRETGKTYIGRVTGPSTAIWKGTL